MLTKNERKMKKYPLFEPMRVIRHVSVLLVVFLLGITSLTLPATAATTGNNSVLVSLVTSSSSGILNPAFSPEVKFGITPTGWSNSDDRKIDLEPPIRYQQILSEIALSGFVGTQMSPAYPTYPDQKDILKSELKLRNVVISEPWVGTYFTEGKKQETVEEFKRQVAFMKEMGGTKIVVAELGGAVHQKVPPVDPLTERPNFSDEQWSDLLAGLNDLGAKATAEGMQLVYHPHIGTGVENSKDIDRLMKGTTADVKLLLDTGHLYYAGVDPLVVTTKYADRIEHVHLKNIRQAVLDESKKTGRGFLDSIRAGIFTVPGDSNGAINFQPILQKLAEAGYKGWLMVEAEQDPNNTNPLNDALTARKYLREVTGL